MSTSLRYNHTRLSSCQQEAFCITGTHEEMPHPAVLVMNGAIGIFAEVGVGFGVVNVELMEVKVLELVFGEAQFPGNVSSIDRKGVIMFWGEGHGEVVK